MEGLRSHTTKKERGIDGIFVRLRLLKLPRFPPMTSAIGSKSYK